MEETAQTRKEIIQKVRQEAEKATGKPIESVESPLEKTFELVGEGIAEVEEIIGLPVGEKEGYSPAKSFLERLKRKIYGS